MRGSHYGRWEYEFSELFGGSPILLNANQVRKTAGLKRALLAYIVSPFFLDPRSPEFVAHQNSGQAVEMARLLGELGYIVDVVNWNDYHSNLARNYDLLLGFGRQAEDLAKELPERTIKIRLATGSEASFANERERERTEAVNRVRDCGLKVVRQSPDRSEYLGFFDAIACIGNRVTAATYRPFFKGAIHTWNNYTYDQWIGLPEGKDFSKSRRNFLYFAGGGQILIGLDLVLEVFVSRPQLSLFVCGPFEGERDFVECFRRELYDTPNIVPVGWVPVGSQRYLELTRMCGSTVYPSCAGASPGSVVVCMGQGLIPIVSREAGMDTDDSGVTLPSVNTEEIGKAVDWISSQTASWHEHTSRKVLRAARQDFSQAAFGKRFREILTAVTRDKTLDSVGE
jgi:hypothetical protein